MANPFQIGGQGQGSPNSLFPQQGTIDWTTLGNTVVQGSLAILNRMSAAGVQPATYGAGLALASRFQLGELGKRRMDEALQNLTGRSGFNEVLFFGFGYKSFISILAEKQQGINCIALCGCLETLHTVPISARVLASLWKT